MYDLIIEVLEIIKRECKKHPDEKADENEVPITCWKCPFYSKDEDSCFFHVGMVEAKIPEEWDTNSLREKLEKENRL